MSLIFFYQLELFMKLLKLSLLALLMSLVVMSCGDDKTTNPDGDPVTPDGKVTVVTSIDGVEKETRVIERKDDDFIPSNYTMSGYHTNLNGLFNMVIADDAGFSVNLFAVLNELKAGTYNFVVDEDQNYGGYRNSKYGEDAYGTSGISLVITKVQYIAITEQVGFYFVSGILKMELENEYNENPNVTVDVAFQDFQIIKTVTGF